MSSVLLILPSGRTLHLARPITDAERDEMLQAENTAILEAIVDRIVKRQSQPELELSAVRP
jgi:hypothetical protein